MGCKLSIAPILMHTGTKKDNQHTFFERCQAQGALGQTQTSQNKKHGTKTPNNRDCYAAARLFHPQKTYVWHNKLCNTLFFFFHGFRHLQETLSSTIGIGHTHPQKRNSREKEKRKNLHRERKESLVVNTQRFPQYIFFLTSEITVSFSSSVSQRRRE